MKKILMPFFIMVILFSLITTVSAQKNINFTVASVYQEGNIMIECAKKFNERDSARRRSVWHRRRNC
jgi:hypothetical protein